MQSDRHVGARIRALREKRGLLQKWLAAEVGWTNRRLCRLERGHVHTLPLDEARKFVKPLGLRSVDDLMPGEE